MERGKMAWMHSDVHRVPPKWSILNNDRDPNSHIFNIYAGVPSKIIKTLTD